MGFALYQDQNYTLSADYFEYFTATFGQYKYFLKDGKYSTQWEEIPSELCGEGRFLNDENLQKNIKLLGNSICPKSDFQLQLKGGSISEIGKSLVFLIGPCKQKHLDWLFPGQNRTCKPINQIQEITERFSVNIFISQQYFDSKDFKNPIKTTQSMQSVPLQKDLKNIFFYQVSSISIELNDSIISNDLYKQTEEIFKMESSETRVYSIYDPKVIGLEFQILLNEKEQEITRKVDTLIIAITNTGGFMSILFVTIQVLIGSLQEKMFFQSLIRKMYLYNSKAPFKIGLEQIRERIINNKNVKRLHL
eukprot:403361582